MFARPSQSKSLAMLLAAAAFVMSANALADDCAKPDLEATFPTDGASSVPLNATLSAVYATSADYLGEAVTLSSAHGERSLNARFDASERRLIVDAPELEANTEYTLAWPALRGLTTAGHGSSKTISFTTGAENDSGPPTFAGISQLEWDWVHPRDECTDDLEPRMRFSFRFGPAVDDGGTESLALLLFQTQGPTVPDDAPRFIAERELPKDGRLNLDLTVRDATGKVCFASVVRDLALNISATGSETRCIETTAPPIFYGCQLGGGASRPLVWWTMAAAATLLTRRRRRAAG
jgi:hypothetical protein